MGCTSRACLVVAASMSAVEALKDQAGLCRWNYVVRSLQQRAKSSMGSLSQAKRTSSSVDRSRRGWQAAAEKGKQSEEALRTVIAYPKPSVSGKQQQPKTSSSSSSSPVSSSLHLYLPCSRPPFRALYGLLIRMVSASKASLIIAAIMAAVEALKDQAGLCRWNYTVGSLHQRAKRSMATLSQAKRMSWSSVDQWRKGGEGAVERAKRTETSLGRGSEKQETSSSAPRFSFSSIPSPPILLPVALYTGHPSLSFFGIRLRHSRSISTEIFVAKDMASASRACLVVTASMSAVEALKDQAGLCRWNYVLRSLQQRTNNKTVGSLSQAKRTSSSIDTRREWQAADAKAKQSEEALRTVVYLSCWGPN
ncbi:unnamed protein product [Musa hybrid cultivar]